MPQGVFPMRRLFLMHKRRHRKAIIMYACITLAMVSHLEKNHKFDIINGHIITALVPTSYA